MFQVFNVDEIIDISGKNIIFIGQNDRKLMNINLTMNRKYFITIYLLYLF